MKFASIILTSLIFILIGCTTKMNIMDKERLIALEKKYANKYSFKLNDDLYLIVKSKQEINDNKQEMLEIYKEFFFNDKDSLRESSYIYLNYYSQNRFLYQIYFDSNKKEFCFSNTEYY